MYNALGVRMEMSKVYFSEKLDILLDRIDFSKLGNNVAIKVHFGEKKCTTYIRSELVREVFDKLISLGKKATLVECNVLYKGSRTNSREHIQTAKVHGFDFAPIDILDGEMGDKFIEVEVKGGLINPVKIGEGLKKYDSMIVLTHFKGHSSAGYGGAFKNIGMGLASREGKFKMHSHVKPSVIRSRCIGCRVCAENCNYNAVKLIESKAKIDSKKCVGCAMCISVCNQKAVKVPWQSTTSENLQKHIINFAEGILKVIPNTMFINFLNNITSDCDCMNYKQTPIIEDIGVLCSEDIVSIDKVSLDIVNKNSGGKFDKINRIDKSVQVNYAVERRLGEENYKLVILE